MMADDPKDTRPESETPGEGQQKVGREQDAKAEEAEREDEGEGEWIPLNSSNVRSMRYKDGVLSVMFVGGRQHDYNVSSDVAHGLETASSPGSYVWKHLRGQGGG